MTSGAIGHLTPSRLTEEIVSRLREFQEDASEAEFSALDVLLIMEATGDFLTKEEIRRLTRETLIADRNRICTQYGTRVPAPEFEEIVDRFLNDLISYAVSEDLDMAIAEAFAGNASSRQGNAS